MERLASGWHEARSVAYEWDGNDDEGTPVASGVYFVRCTLDGEVTGSRAVVLRQ
ncbi:MAG: hypothetical protein KDA27_19685 [Candidatus Eisenbacteria bacterium]|uniref:FlgD Ig-like domain-containing protein n=1 Tax=Eiseniibacteriota bacterium TaxID=2212470 RepID=A0A956NJ64_UNCEI|nr:hypothetical protein [Candidatus Eisenbacteria bacterium]